MPITTPHVHSDHTPPELEAIRRQVLAAADAASGKKAEDIAILEVGPLVGITDYFLLLSASNDRLLGAVLEELEAKLARDHNRKPISREGEKEAGWVVLDYGDYVVHAFTTPQREHYDLERLWSDAPRVPWSEPVSPVIN